MLGVAQPVGIREANGFGNEWKPGGLPEPNPTEPAGETGFAAHPICSRLPVLVRAGFVGCRLSFGGRLPQSEPLKGIRPV